MGRNGTSAAVHKYLTRRIGQVVFMEDMTKDLGVEPHQVSRAISYLRSRSIDLEIVTAGEAYRMINASKTTATPPAGEPPEVQAPIKAPARAVRPQLARRIFEEIGQARDGVVIQDTNGNLYLAKEL